MSEFKPPANSKEFEANFKQLKPLMNDTQAYYESSRCLFCYDAPCIQACPTGIDIPLFIRQINTGNKEGAAKTIFNANYFGYACGKVCPTEVLCEGACVFNHQDVRPIEIGSLQTYATDQVISNKTSLFELAQDRGKKVAIIGAGPAGISCACELQLLGYSVAVFEAKALPSGLTVHGIAPYKITNQEVLDEMNWLQNQFGFEIVYNRKIESGDDFKVLEENYDAIFIGIGLGKTRKLGLIGENLSNSIGAVEFIEGLRLDPLKTKVPPKVIVIGGGNTAMDAASEAARLGAESVILAYRRDKSDMSAYDFEFELAKSVGVKGLFNVQPVEIMGNEKVTGVKFMLTKEVGNQPEIIPGTEFVEACDLVIKATGQEKQQSVLQEIENLQLDSKGRISVNKSTFQTNNPKYFAGGDAVNGGAEVVNAAADGKQAAKGIHFYLSNP